MIKNREQIIENASTSKILQLRDDALHILEKALMAIDPKKAVMNKVRRVGDKIEVMEEEINLDEYSDIYVIGGGKAGGEMAEALEYILGERITEGYINILSGTKADYSTKRITLNEASHPVPDERGLQGVRMMLGLAEKAKESDLIFVLISGGGSALMPSPAEGIPLDDLRSVTRLFLMSGATINELNAVRKHISSFKGGLLAQKCHPARVYSLILSDVVGDPLDTIASGPTAPDSTTYNVAVEALKRRGIWGETPESIKDRLDKGRVGAIDETPKIDNPVFDKVKNIVLAGNATAAEAAMEASKELSYNSMILSTLIEGEARHVGTCLAGIVRELSKYDRPIEKPASIIVGGETTVHVTGEGVGGRNQELVLSAAHRLGGIECVVASLATDGIDGPTDSAGAIVDGYTESRAHEGDYHLEKYLEDNDSNTFFRKLGDVIITGPTGTNVNDLVVMLVG
ncbi:MAG: glycerate kinase [Candidatus Bathyarchaeia archaeon]